MTEMPDAAAVERETGQEKATATCPNCGATVGVLETPYGSTAAQPCPKCYPKAQSDAGSDANARQQAGVDALQRQTGTPTPVTAPGPSDVPSAPAGA